MLLIMRIIFMLCFREIEWMFSTDSGCESLAESAGFERLVVVTLHRGHQYGGIERVKEEVAGSAMEFGQRGLPESRKVWS